MRRGVVMIMTLALVMVLTLAVLKSTTITQKYMTDMSDTIFFAQFNRTFLDMGVIIEELGREIDDQDIFAAALKMPLIISDDESKIEGVLILNSAANRFNINQLIDSNSSINQTLYDIIYSVATEYQLNDGLFLMALILDAIDNDKEERAFESEFTHLDGATMIDGAILDRKAFAKIEDFYAKSRNDGKIYNIPWDKIITYSGEKRDYNYLTSEIKAILDENYGISSTYSDSDTLISEDDDLNLDDEQKKVLQKLQIEYYVPIFSCNFEFHFLEKSMNVAFEYNLKTRRMSNIETIF